jgi:hypothetical protein
LDAALFSLAKVTIGTSNNHNISVGIAKPELAVVGVSVHFKAFKHLGSMVLSALERFIDLVGLEPENDAVAVGLRFRIPKMWMRVGVPMVELHDHEATEGKSLVFDASGSAFETQHSLIPKAAGFNVTNRDKRLWGHVSPCH